MENLLHVKRCKKIEMIVVTWYYIILVTMAYIEPNTTIVSNETMSDGNKIIYNNGDVYIGSVNQLNEKDGLGCYTCNRIRIGCFYQGEFKNNKKHGKCVKELYWGTMFEGEYEDNKRHGIGKETYQDGTWSNGSYTNDRRHGKFNFIDVAGREYSYVYKDGIPDRSSI